MPYLILLLFTALFFPFGMYSQPYESIFGKNSTMWVFEWHNLGIDAQDTVYVSKDTIINGLEWKKINVSVKSHIYEGGLLREDTSSGEVWYRGLQFVNCYTDTMTFHLYDFSLEKGDIFDVSNMWTGYSGTTATENTVDTTYYKNGRKFIEFKGTYYGEPYTFIEGVGGNLGVLWKQYCGGLQSQYLLCSYKDGIQTYANKQYNGKCDVYAGVAKSTAREHQVTIYPNPFTEYISFDIDAHLPIEKTVIFNINGEMVYSGNYSPSIDLGYLPAGLYSIRLLTADNKYLYKRILKL